MLFTCAKLSSCRVSTQRFESFEFPPVTGFNYIYIHLYCIVSIFVVGTSLAPLTLPLIALSVVDDGFLPEVRSPPLNCRGQHPSWIPWNMLRYRIASVSVYIVWLRRANRHVAGKERTKSVSFDGSEMHDRWQVVDLVKRKSTSKESWLKRYETRYAMWSDQFN